MKPQIRSAVLCDYAELARSVGLDPVAMLNAAGLPATSLAHSDLMLPADRVCVLLEASAERGRMPTFGLALARNRRLSHLGELGLVLRDQPTLGHMVQVATDLARFHNEALVYALERDAEYAHIHMENCVGTGGPTRQFCEFVIGSTFRMFQALFGGAWRETRVCFGHGAAADRRWYVEFFGAEPFFGHCFNGFIFRLSLLDKVNSSADPGFSRYTRGLIEAKVAAMPGQRSDDVRRIALQLLPKGQCSADRIAACLGVDRRTVHRQLAREGQTVTGLIDEIRREFAARHVLESDLPIGDVASLLGFQSTSALVNWYSKRFAQSPAQHRRNARSALPMQ